MSKELESLEPSVVLKFVDGLLKRYEGKTDYNIYITKDWLLEIKQALLKKEQPKQYLKWEDLEFEKERQTMEVKLGDAYFYMTCYLYKSCTKKVWIRNKIISFELKDNEEDKQFFNDLRLERVEE